jgi:hypothetical protein
MKGRMAFEFGLGVLVLCGTNRGGAEVAEEARRKAVDGGEFEMRGGRSLDRDGWDLGFSRVDAFNRRWMG